MTTKKYNPNTIETETKTDIKLPRISARERPIEMTFAQGSEAGVYLNVNRPNKESLGVLLAKKLLDPNPEFVILAINWVNDYWFYGTKMCVSEMVCLYKLPNQDSNKEPVWVFASSFFDSSKSKHRAFDAFIGRLDIQADLAGETLKFPIAAKVSFDKYQYTDDKGSKQYAHSAIWNQIDMPNWVPEWLKLASGKHTLTGANSGEVFVREFVECLAIKELPPVDNEDPYGDDLTNDYEAHADEVF